jgi:hypothetical protein
VNAFGTNVLISNVFFKGELYLFYGPIGDFPLDKEDAD